MATPIYTPRVNNNDDVVRLTRVLVKPGDSVRAGDVVAEVETDKASFPVEADGEGFVLAVAHQIDEMLTVGSVLLWLGAAADESVPAPAGAPAAVNAAASEPTVKAVQLLSAYGLRADQVPASGDRLTAKDVEAFVAAHGIVAAPAATGGMAAPIGSALPPVRPAGAASDGLAAGKRRSLTMSERGMLRTVVWQRDEAVPAYVEFQYDVRPWEQYAAALQGREGLLLSPLLSVMAYRLARLAAERPNLNSTLEGSERLVYDAVNLGFTVQSDTTLYLAVVENAAALTERQFIDRLGQLQRSALSHSLRQRETSAATIAFSSMARWQATRHVPVLPPHTSLIVAHAAASGGLATLGATYDHRVLTGFDALSALRSLADPGTES